MTSPEFRNEEGSLIATDPSHDAGETSGTALKDIDVISKFWADIVSDTDSDK